jgi:hypothetical protein
MFRLLNPRMLSVVIGYMSCIFSGNLGLGIEGSVTVFGCEIARKRISMPVRSGNLHTNHYRGNIADGSILT